jgi:hypothetical protein
MNLFKISEKGRFDGESDSNIVEPLSLSARESCRNPPQGGPFVAEISRLNVKKWPFS